MNKFEQNVILDFPQDKITKYLLFEPNKFAMMRSMGYNKENADELYKKISQEVSQGFLNNQYQIKTLNNHGQHIQINFILDGKNEHSHERYSCHTGCVVWPKWKNQNRLTIIKRLKEKKHEMVRSSKSYGKQRKIRKRRCL